MITQQHCPVQRRTWKSVLELSTNPWLPDQVSPLHNHDVSALYTISISPFCPAAPLTAKINSCPQHALTFWVVSMLSLFKTVTVHNSTFFRQNRDTSIQCPFSFLDGPWKIKVGVSSAQWQLGAKLTLAITLSLTPERKLYSGKSSSPAALSYGTAAPKWQLRGSPLGRTCLAMAPSVQSANRNIVHVLQSD